MPIALITGITGQDGSYLAELLLAKGYRVIGTVREDRNSDVVLPQAINGHVELTSWDMCDQRHIERLLAKYSPQEIYNFAGYTSGAGMFDEPVEIAKVNGLSVACMLEAVLAVDRKIRFCQASSREVFGDAMESPQSEITPANPRSPYGASKLYADNMIKIYRKRYGLFACSAILFNHESPRRRIEFVTRKITHTAAKIKLGMASELHLGNLDAQRDWGFAGDYVQAMWLMMQQTNPSDYVIATGEIYTVRDLCRLAFGYLDLNYQDYVRGDDINYRPAEPAPLVGDITKAKSELEWYPKTDFRQLIHMMVCADFCSLSKEAKR